MDARDIIIKPIITEKSMQLFNRDNKYTFKVAKDANKIQIREAIEEIFRHRNFQSKSSSCYNNDCKRQNSP